MPLIRIEDRTGPMWINPARVNALTPDSGPRGDNPHTRVWFSSGIDPDTTEQSSIGDFFVVYLPLDEVARLLNE